VVVESRHVCVQYDGESYALETNRDITERKAHEEYVHLLMREVSHRAKNILSVVQAIAQQTACKNPEQFLKHFSERVRALSANHDLLLRNEWKGVDVDDLVHSQLAPFADLIGLRVAVRGPKLRLNAAAAQAIGFAFYELTTNAGKYGALDRRRAHRHLVAARGQYAHHQLDRKRGPPVVPPTWEGFGSTVINTMVKQSLGGEVSLHYAPSGHRWQLTCPATNALEPAELGTAQP
jgi:two-component sensor histidine kinase